jgi:lactoylglutathione lyase
MKFRQLDHVALHVQDVQRSCEFYERVLGLQSIPRPAFSFPGAWYRLGQTQELHLIGNREAPVQSHSRGTHYALLVDDMDAWERHLRDLAVEYLPRRTRPDGAYQIYVVDPDGHHIELCTDPGVANAGSG